MNTPNISNVFSTVESYKYSTAVGLFLLYFVSLIFPVGWETASTTWQFCIGVLFFLSLGMIIVKDLFPWLKKIYVEKTGR